MSWGAAGLSRMETREVAKPPAMPGPPLPADVSSAEDKGLCSRLTCLLNEFSVPAVRQTLFSPDSKTGNKTAEFPPLLELPHSLVEKTDRSSVQ